MKLAAKWYSTYQSKNVPLRFKYIKFDGANLWKKLYHELLYKEHNLTKTKLKKLLQMHFQDTRA